MGFNYKKEIILEILGIVECLNYSQLFNEIKHKYNLSSDYFNTYLNYCMQSNYINEIYVQDNTVGSNEIIFVGYKLTILGKKYIRNT